MKPAGSFRLYAATGNHPEYDFPSDAALPRRGVLGGGVPPIRNYADGR